MHIWVKLLQAWDGHAVDTELSLSKEQADKLIADKMAEKIDAPSQVMGVTTAITTEIVSALTASLPEMVGAELKKQIANYATDNDGKNGLKTALSITGEHDNQKDDPTHGFKYFSEFALSVRNANPNVLQGKKLDERLLVHAPTGMSEISDPDGGFLVPPEHLQTLLKLAWDASDLFGRTTKIPMATNSIDMPVVTNTDRRKGHRNGGIQVYWVAEAAQKTKSKPAFGKVGLKLNEIAGLVYVTNTLLEDSPISLEPLLGPMFAQEFAIEVDDAIFSGTGAGQPLGILNAPCLVTTPHEFGQAAATLVSENIINMWSRMWSPSKKRAIWFVAPDTLPQLMTMTIDVGTGGHALWLPANTLAGQPYSTLFGRPVIELEQASLLGTIGDITLCDYSYYLIGQKAKGLQTATSIHLRFDWDETAFRYVMRLDGQPWWNSVITPMNGGPTQSPFVALETRP